MRHDVAEFGGRDVHRADDTHESRRARSRCTVKYTEQIHVEQLGHTVSDKLSRNSHRYVSADAVPSNMLGPPGERTIIVIRRCREVHEHKEASER